MTDQQKTRQLRSKLMSFFRQRTRAYHSIMNPENRMEMRGKISIGQTLIRRFNLIQTYNYWRHCLEVKNQEGKIYEILPSENGRHQSIRLRMIGLVDRCKQVCSISYQEYAESNRA